MLSQITTAFFQESETFSHPKTEECLSEQSNLVGLRS